MPIKSRLRVHFSIIRGGDGTRRMRSASISIGRRNMIVRARSCGPVLRSRKAETRSFPFKRSAGDSPGIARAAQF